MKRCPRCAHPNADDAAGCAGCGFDLAADTSTAGTAGPAGAAAAGSDAGAAGPAPWERPPEVATRVEDGPRWRPGEPGPAQISAAPPRAEPRWGYPYQLGRRVSVLFVVEGVLAAAYGILAITWRRGVFDRIAADRDAVPAGDARVSDLVNGVLFTAVAVVTVVAIVALVWWVRRARPHVDRISFGVAGWTMTAFGVLGVAVGLGMHTGSDAAQLGTGYIVLGAGWLLLAGSSARVVRAVGRSGRLADAHAGRARSAR